MGGVFRGVAFLGVAVASAVVTLALLARGHDGPLGPFPGGSLSGELVGSPVRDWSFAREVPLLELELQPEAPRSISASCVVWKQRLYVPFLRPERSPWPDQVLSDGRVKARIAERLYPVQAVLVVDPAELAAVKAALTGKYDLELDGLDDDTVWIFRLESRSATT